MQNWEPQGGLGPRPPPSYAPDDDYVEGEEGCDDMDEKEGYDDMNDEEGCDDMDEEGCDG